MIIQWEPRHAEARDGRGLHGDLGALRALRPHEGGGLYMYMSLSLSLHIYIYIYIIIHVIIYTHCMSIYPYVNTTY